MNDSTYKMSPAFRISALLGIDITHLRVIACLKLLYKVRNYQAINNTFKKLLAFCAGAIIYVSPL